MAAAHEKDERPGGDATATTVVESIECRVPASADELVGSDLGPYRLVRLLGQGAMGIVYEARELDGGAVVALKLLRNADENAILGLKREFRHLASLRHPNLIELYALHAEEHEWFITMQCMEGVSLLDHVWGGPAYGRFDHQMEGRVRHAILQLSRAVSVLHEHGVLHRDIKPNNAMVERDGHLRLLDFGLSRGLRADRSTPTSSLSGTPAYMAPELFAQAPPGPSQDWFGVGAVLYHALTGRRPFAGQLSQRAAAPSEMPPPPNAVNADVPEDLSALAMALLDPDPTRRADADHVFAALGVASGMRSQASDAHVFVGRAHELDQIRAHFLAAQSSSPGWVEIVAETGFGKSALVARFIEQVVRERDVLLLSGRCFERESVPFQAFDDIAAQLAEHLLRDRERPELASDLAEASRLLPVLSAQKPSDEGLSAVERRRRGLVGFKNVLLQLSHDYTIVLVIDDTQWIDQDSARLLEEILAVPMPSRVLVLTSARKADENVSFSLSQKLTEHHFVTRPVLLKLEPLTNAESDHLLCALSPELSSEARARIAQESSGVPLFLAELAHQDPTSEDSLSITKVLARRIESLTPAELKAIRLLSLFARPMPQKLLAEAAGVEAARPKVIAALRHAGLVRTSGPLATDDVEIYHARIAAIVRDTIPDRERIALLDALERSLATSALTTPELRGHFAHLAGRNQEAAQHAVHAAQRAEHALAFEQAALWYERALEWDDLLPRRDDVERACADAFVHAGHSQRAATLFEKLAQGAGQDRRGELLRLASEAWFTAGEIERGLEVIGPLLSELDVPYPRASWKTLGQFATELLQVRFTWLGRKTAAVAVSREREIADVCWTVAKGVGLLLPLEGAVYHLRSLRAARNVGDHLRTARVLAVFSTTLGALGVFAELAAQMALEARRVAESRTDRYLLGLCDVACAIDETVRGGRPENVDALARRGLVHLVESGLPVTWETDLARCLFLIASHQLGRLRTLEREAGIWLAEAIDRGDIYAQILAHHMLACATVAKGDLEATREHALLPIGRWRYERYTVPHHFAARLVIQATLGCGDFARAEALLMQEWPRFEKAQLLRYENPGLEIIYLRAVAMQHRAFESSISAGERRLLERYAAKLKQTKKPHFMGHGMMISASLLARDGATARARVALEEGLEMYERAGQVLAARCAERRLRELSGSAEQIAQVDRWMVEAGIDQPASFVNTQCPPVRASDLW